MNARTLDDELVFMVDLANRHCESLTLLFVAARLDVTGFFHLAKLVLQFRNFIAKSRSQLKLQFACR